LLYLRQHSEKTAVIDNEITLTYKELFDKASLIAKKIKLQASVRQHVAILLPNSANYVVAYCAALLADCVVIPIYYNATPQEIKHCIEFCDVSILITTDADAKELCSQELRHRLTIININTLESTVIGNKSLIAYPASPSDVSVILGTSGSTNSPKRVMLSDENMIENALGIIQSLGYTENERILVVLPLTFASGNTSQLIVSLVLSATICIYHGALHPKLFYATIKKYRITSTTVVPSILKIILDGRDHTKECETLKTLCFGGGPTDNTTIKRVMNSPLRKAYVQMYGQTEASTRISHLHYNDCFEKENSVGKQLYNICVRIDATDNEVGEIYVKGKNVMRGYYKETVSPITNGWLATGDIGYMDSDGYLYICGRKKNLIIVSGMNVYAEEVENILRQSPAVSEALVYGVCDENRGEIPVADVVLATDANITEQELKAYCSASLSEYKVPAQINFVKALERTYNGKIARKRRNDYE